MAYLGAVAALDMLLATRLDPLGARLMIVIAIAVFTRQLLAGQGRWWPATAAFSLGAASIVVPLGYGLTAVTLLPPVMSSMADE